MDDTALLREYATRNSEAAFGLLVSRRVRFVYSAALRQVRDPYLAEEVTQAVFIILAKKAGKIRNETHLSGWLFKTTRFAAIAQTRAAARRRQHEQEAQMQSENQTGAPDPLWEQMSPLLDEALAHLGEKDRQAILLRFLKAKAWRKWGSSLGTGEDTARMRISRALEKLRRHFLKRGCGFNDGPYRGGHFRQFPSSRSNGAGNNHNCDNCQRVGCRKFNPDPCERNA